MAALSWQCFIDSFLCLAITIKIECLYIVFADITAYF